MAIKLTTAELEQATEFQKDENKWMALAEGKVVVAGKRVKNAQEKTTKMGLSGSSCVMTVRLTACGQLPTGSAALATGYRDTTRQTPRAGKQVSRLSTRYAPYVDRTSRRHVACSASRGGSVDELLATRR
jgi:hypothetical protein